MHNTIRKMYLKLFHHLLFESPSVIVIKKKLISGLREASFSFPNEPDFTSCFIFSILFLWVARACAHTHTHTLSLSLSLSLCHNKVIILELLSKLNLPPLFHWIEKLYSDMFRRYNESIWWYLLASLPPFPFSRIFTLFLLLLSTGYSKDKHITL